MHPLFIACVILALLFGAVFGRRALGIALAAVIGIPLIATLTLVTVDPPKGNSTWGPGCPAGMQLNWGNCVPPESVEPVDPTAFDSSKYFAQFGKVPPPAQPASDTIGTAVEAANRGRAAMGLPPLPVESEQPPQAERTDVYKQSLQILSGEKLTPLN